MLSILCNCLFYLVFVRLHHTKVFGELLSPLHFSQSRARLEFKSQCDPKIPANHQEPALATTAHCFSALYMPFQFILIKL